MEVREEAGRRRVVMRKASVPFCAGSAIRGVEFQGVHRGVGHLAVLAGKKPGQNHVLISGNRREHPERLGYSRSGGAVMEWSERFGRRPSAIRSSTVLSLPVAPRSCPTEVSWRKRENRGCGESVLLTLSGTCRLAGLPLTNGIVTGCTAASSPPRIVPSFHVALHGPVCTIRPCPGDSKHDILKEDVRVAIETLRPPRG